MDNHLSNGTVLPSGLLGQDYQAAADGFNKNYANTSLRVGIVVECYPIGNAKNFYNLTTEYDVLVIEQNADRGATPQLYRNCMSAEGMGSTADYFEKNLRFQTKDDSTTQASNLSGQNGAIVLILCIDAMSMKGLIIGSLTHPDRNTNLVNNKPFLEGEYNGVNIKVNNDGSTSLTFNGATDNDGDPTDTTQGTTALSIATDGSYQVQVGGTVTQTFSKNGDVSLDAKGDISNVNQGKFVISTQENISLTAVGDYSLTSNNWSVYPSGSALLQCQQQVQIQSQSAITLQGSQLQIQAEAMASITAPTITLDGVVSLGGAGGMPLLTLSAIMIGTGNLGIPVISTVISGFTFKVTGQ